MEPRTAQAIKRAEEQRGGGIPLGHIAGVKIVADWSLLIIFVLVMINLGVGVFPNWHPDWSPALVWAVAFGAAVLFFVSVLLHELSHAVVGRAQGVPVSRITLFMFGGMAHTEKEPPSPKSELLMAAAGPATSLAIGFGATLLGALLTRTQLSQIDDPSSLLASMGPLATLLLWLGPVNIILGVFNLVPGFPLDGGRVLRAILWAATKDLEKATRWAALGGQLVAWALIALGVTSLFGGSLGQGIWLMLIGWFLLSAARASYLQTMIQGALRGARVREVMRRAMTTVPPELPVSSLVTDFVMTTDQQAFPVVSADGHLQGIVTLEDVRKVTREAWEQTSVAQIMTPASALATLPAEAPATDALRELGERNVDQVPVVESDGSLLGMVRRADILRWITLHSPHVPAR